MEYMKYFMYPICMKFFPIADQYCTNDPRHSIEPNAMIMTLHLLHPATPGEDFQLLSEEVTFAVGEMVKSVSLIVNDDEWVEFREEFSIRLLPEDKLLLGSHSTFYIIDNDS